MDRIDAEIDVIFSECRPQLVAGYYRQIFTDLPQTSDMFYPQKSVRTAHKIRLRNEKK